MRLLRLSILISIVFVSYSCKKESFVPEDKEPVIVEDIPCEDIRIPVEFKLDSTLTVSVRPTPFYKISA
jgi:hypothetical protein